MRRRGWTRWAGLLGLAGMIGGAAPTPVQRSGIWRPPSGLRQEPIWPGAAPDMAAAGRSAEHSETSINPQRFAGRPVTGVFDVTAPTITVFPAKGIASHAAMLVFPGGGFQMLAIDLEGSEACDWLTARGIVCILVKYRVPNSNHHWDPVCKCAVTPKRLLALQDAQRAIRLVRSRAATLRIDPHRIGVIGFSAGGYLVAQTSNILTPAYRPVDAIDRVSSRPDLAVALYPGHLCRAGATLDPGIHVSARTPPTLLVQAWDDPTDPICNSIVYARALDEAGVPAEVHLFGKGGHAFALRRTGLAVDGWTGLLERWLKDNRFL